MEPDLPDDAELDNIWQQIDAAGRAEPPRIIRAARNCEVNRLRTELDYGVPVDHGDCFGSTPLQNVCDGVCTGHELDDDRIACAKLLVERGACVDAGLPDAPGRNPFAPHMAQMHFTPLTEAAKNNNLRLVKILLSAGADVNAQIEQGYHDTATPLCCAVSKPRFTLHGKRACASVVDILLKSGADANGPKFEGRNAIEWAIGTGSHYLWPILLRGGAIIPNASEDENFFVWHEYQYWDTHRAHPYLRKIDAAGGFKAYEKAHRAALQAIFVPKFTHLLPPELVPLILEFSFHLGFY